MSERTDDPTFRYYDYDAASKDNFSFGEHMYYTTNEGHDPVHASETLSPGMLNKFDQEQNKEWWDEQRQPSHQPSIGERARSTNFDNEVKEGIAVSDRVSRGYMRANFAQNEVNTNAKRWATESQEWYKRDYPKCNEFVYEAHASGDPLGSNYPKVRRLNPLNYKPTVDLLANKDFAPDTLEYRTDVQTPWPGDTMVWYGDGNHHSAIVTGNGNVAYASTYGAKTNTIEDANKHFVGTPPVIRRFK